MISTVIMSLNINQYLMFFNINQAVIFALILFLTASIIKKSRIFLGLYMLFYAISHVFIFYYINFDYHSALMLNLFFLYFPLFSATPVLFYFYITLITNYKLSRRKTMLHLGIPVFLFLTIATCYLPQPDSSKQEFVFNMFNFILNKHSGFLDILGFSAMLIIIGQVFFYIILIFKLIKNNDKLIEQHYAHKENLSLQWVKYVFYFFIVSYFVYFIAGNYTDLFTDEATKTAYNINQIILTFVLGFFGIKQEKQQIVNKPPALNNNNSLSLNKTDKKQIEQKLLAYMQQEKPYINSDLKIDTLAQALNTNRSYLSLVIKDMSGLNFCNFINKYRVEQFIKIYSQRNNHNKYNIQGIAFEIGFKSKSSFYHAFRKFKSTTPIEYIKKSKNIKD
ncbi:MAG: AraC family transcriptional regulator [Bacteroidales bacterium]